MKKISLTVLVAAAVLSVWACQDNLTNPLAVSKPIGTTTTETATTTDEAGKFVGAWLAVKAEAWDPHNPATKRDLVAEGGAVTLVLEGDQVPPLPEGRAYSLTVEMPGEPAGIIKGVWHYHEAWGKPQIDFYSQLLLSLPDLEYGEIPSLVVGLDGTALILNDGGCGLLPYDFGWSGGARTSRGWSTVALDLRFVRKQ